MIWRSVGGRVETMTVPCYGGEALVLFGHEEEAKLFLRSCGADYDAGWRIRESRTGEVASVLCGPCANVERVVLDPPPMTVAEGLAALASTDRAGFVAYLLAPDGAAEGSRSRRTLRGRNFGPRERGI